MSAISLLVHLLFKTFFLALPVGVAWLAFRRLSLSESRNAWLYSGVGLFASVAALGLAPWALGLTGASWIFLLLALMCPLVWIATVMYCDLQASVYGDEEPVEWIAERFQSRRAITKPPVSTPLVLTEQVPQPAPLFRHRRPDLEPPLEQSVPERSIAASAETAPFVAARPAPKPIAETPRTSATRKVLDVARDMRGDGARHLRKDLVTADERGMPFLRGTA